MSFTGGPGLPGMTHNHGLVLLTIRGTLKTTKIEEAREIHNMTAGNAQGVAAARSLGDLSHNVYVPLGDAPGAVSELLFLDLWNNVDGLQTFFADAQVQAGGAMMFASREPTLWQASDMRSTMLPTPAAKTERYVGLIRGTVTSRDAAREVFDEIDRTTINAARMKGQISHQVFWRLPAPGEAAPLELLGVDTWLDADGMKAFYSEGSVKPVYSLFSAPPSASMWKQPAGSWVEW